MRSKKKEKRVRFLWLLIFLLLGSIALGFTSTKLFAPKNHIIYLTANGFSPESITVRKGDSITWVNSDIRYHWPASNHHPTHKEYPTDKKGCLGSYLDACRGLKKGETYTFIFDKVGVFGMHDHLSPGDTLSVRVRKKSVHFLGSEVESERGNVVDTKNLPAAKEFRSLNYEKKHLLMKGLAKDDPAMAWNYLKKVAMKNGEVVDNVHEFAHLIGHGIYNKFGFKGITKCSIEFAYGCYHGVTEQMLLKEGKSAIPRIEKECIKFYSPTSKKPNDPGCIHGIGHGLLTWNNLELDTSLKDCDKIGISYRSYCWDGVFMEYSTSGVYSFDSSNSWQLCLSVENVYREKCASYLVTIFSKSAQFDVNKFAQMCMEAPSKHLGEACASKIGNKIAQINRGDKDKILNGCNEIELQEAATYCLMGAVREVAFQKYQNWDTVIPELCGKVPIESEASCYNYEN